MSKMCCLEESTKPRQILRDGDVFLVSGKCGYNRCLRMSQIPTDIDVLPYHDKIIDTISEGLRPLFVTDVYCIPSSKAVAYKHASIIGSISTRESIIMDDISYQNYIARKIPFKVQFPDDVYRSDLIHEAICELSRLRSKVGGHRRHAPCIHSVARFGTSPRNN